MTDNVNLPAKLRKAAKRADHFQTGEQGLLNRAADVIEAAEEALTPTDDEREALANQYIATRGDSQTRP